MTGEKCVEILREHYISKGKPCIIVLYTKPTSLKMTEDCSLTENDLKAKSSLKTAGEEEPKHCHLHRQYTNSYNTNKWKEEAWPGEEEPKHCHLHRHYTNSYNTNKRREEA